MTSHMMCIDYCCNSVYPVENRIMFALKNIIMFPFVVIDIAAL